MNPELEDFTAKVVPVTVLTWEVADILLGANQETAGIPIVFPEPVEIVGLVPTIARAGAPAGGGLVLATLDDVAVELEANNHDRITNRLRGDGATITMSGTSFVTLAALDTEKRSLRWCLTNAKPDVTAKFRWKPDVSGGAIFEDALISIAFLIKPYGRD
jgi:hypothetical protein